MKKLICFPSNPLNGQEFDHLLKDFELLRFQTTIHKRPLTGSKLESLIQSIHATAKLEGDAPITLVGYSWGAYLAMAYLKRFPENVEGVLLINPLLTDNHPLSRKEKFLFATPILRSLILKFRGKKLANRCLNSFFAPSVPPQELNSLLMPSLLPSKVWRGAACYKKMMHQHPLPNDFSEIQVPIRILCGESDQVAHSEEQLALLKSIESMNVKIISSAGHALLWTHQEEVLVELTRFFNQIHDNKRASHAMPPSC
jgi:pimeloyl-ACP methyl ester carboxylesterase